jgi:hypothetical protein
MRITKSRNKKVGKSVNIFCHETGVLVAAGVILNRWCGVDKSLRANLAATLRRDLTKPCTKYNPYHSRGMYAEYVTSVE